MGVLPAGGQGKIEKPIFIRRPLRVRLLNYKNINANRSTKVSLTFTILAFALETIIFLKPNTLIIIREHPMDSVVSHLTLDQSLTEPLVLHFDCGG